MRAPGTNSGNEKALGATDANDSVEAAKEAGLQYVSDDRPGYTRRASNGEFDYLDTQGAAKYPTSSSQGSQIARSTTAKSACGRCAVARTNFHPGWQRGVRAREQIIWFDHDEKSARDGEGCTLALSVSWKEPTSTRS